MNALANPKVGKYVNEHFVSAFQRVGTFRIVGKAKQGGNVATYFCAPDGRVLHSIAGPVNATVMLREAKWVVETATRIVKECNGDGGKFRILLRKAHTERLRKEHGLVVQAVMFDPPDPKEKSALTYRDPTGRPLAPKLPPSPVQGPDVKFRYLAKAAPNRGGGFAAGCVVDLKGRGWRLSNQGRVHQLMAAHAMTKIEDVYGAVFEGILGERITTAPVQIVHPFPWNKKR